MIMKNISKFLMIIVAGALTLASCDAFQDEMEPTKPIAAPEVAIAVSNIGDNAFTFTLTPDGEASYYGYLVVEADQPQPIDSSALYAMRLNGLAKGIVKYADEPTKTVTLEKLKPYQKYQIYAVAGSVGGNVGSVSVKSVRTTDTTEPVLEVDEDGAVTSFVTQVDGKKAAVAFVFDDEITLVETAKVTGAVYGENYSNADGSLIALKTFNVPKDSLSTNGTVLIVSVPEEQHIPGAFVALSVDKNTVKNASGLTNSADYNINLLFDDPDDNQGAFFQYDYEDFLLVPDFDATKLIIYSDYTTVLLSFTPALAAADLNDVGKTKKDIQVTSKDAQGRQVSYFLQKQGLNAAGKLLVGLDEAPGFGTTQSYSIPQGCLFDVYGNESAELVLKNQLLCSYGYTLDDITGTYAVTGDSYFDGAGAINTTWVIAASDNATKGNVMLTTYHGLPCSVSNIYADFNVHTGELVIPDRQHFFSTSKYLVYFATAGGDFVTLSVPAAGTFTGPKDNLFGVYLTDLEGTELGWNEIYTGVEGTRAAPAAKKADQFSISKDFIIQKGFNLKK
jgi:hypothetical protein